MFRIGSTAAAGLVAFALGGLGTANAATTTEYWSGDSSFTSGSIAFAGIETNELVDVEGFGTYVASFQAGRFGGNYVNTTFDLLIDLNGTWTQIATWNTSSGFSQYLVSAISAPLTFTKGLVSGIQLTASPNDPGDNYDSMNFETLIGPFEEAFTFQDVTATPLPPAVSLFAGGLGIIGMMSRRRKRKTVSLAG